MIHEIFIFTPDGRCLKSWEFNSRHLQSGHEQSEMMRCAFMSAIFNFGLHVHNQELNTVKFGCQAYYFLKNEKIITSICCDVEDSNIEIIKKMLLKISFTFLQKYRGILENWNGNIQVFNGYKLPESININILERNSLKNYDKYFENVKKYKEELINYISVTNLPDTSKKRILQLIENMNLICNKVYQDYVLEKELEEM
ncbi:MAG: hypothetical protein EAX96_06905 [Candidatus Lokiarchaeota archaeon]|nr:hypothetical protein [Candidatus Lokiarchaeota archaeon]